MYSTMSLFKSLLNTLHPLGKLVWWGLALQEVDLTIHYWPGRTNIGADSLSCFPVILSSGHVVCLQEFPPVVGNDNSPVGVGDDWLEKGITLQ